MCVSISRRSASVSGPGFCRIRSGIPILPTSWSMKPYSTLSSSQTSGAATLRQLDGVALHALRVLAGAVSFDSSALASAVTVSW